MENNTEVKTASAFDAFLARTHTRNGFLKAVAAAGIGAAAGSTLLTKDAEAQAALSDVELLNFALTIEYFESEVFYPAALEAGILSGEALAVVQQLAEVEAVHRDALIAGIQSLGGTPIPRPQYTIPPGILTSQQAFLEAALQQEIVDVGANLGVGPLIQNPDILAAAGAIAGQEGENVVAFRNLLGVVPPANEAFPAALTQEQVLAALAPFLGVGGGASSGGGGGRGQLPATGGPGA
jgi:hypothetical protein